MTARTTTDRWERMSTAGLKSAARRMARKARAHKAGLRAQANAIEVWKKRYYEQLERANSYARTLDEIVTR